MPGVDAWGALADEVVALGDPALRASATSALVALGMSGDEQRQLMDTIVDREDPAGEMLFTVARLAPRSEDDGDGSAGRPFPSPARMDAALEAAARVQSGPAATVVERLHDVDTATLADLPPDAAGTLAAGLLRAALTLPTSSDRAPALDAVLHIVSVLDSSRFPVASMLTDVVRAGPSGADALVAAQIVALAPRARLVSGALDAVRDRVDPAAVLALLHRVGEVRVSGADGTDRAEVPTTAQPPMPTGPPMPSRQPEPSAPPPAPAGRGRGGLAASIIESVRDAVRDRPAVRWRGVRRKPQQQQEQQEQQQEQAATRAAYPRIDIRSKQRANPQVAVLEEPFEVIVGLGRYKDTKIVQTPAMTFKPGESVDLDLVLVFDPTSLKAHGATRLRVTVTDANPYPVATTSFEALYREDLPVERRLGVHYLRDGQIVGIAWRTFVVVRDADEVPSAPVPLSREEALLDLDPLLDDDVPDLTLSICASDGAATGEFVWTAFPGAASVTVPDAPRISRIGRDLEGFVADVRKTVQFSQGPLPDYTALKGKAKRIGQAVPDGIVSVLRELLADSERRSAPTVLLLTEELTLPWELAVLDPPLKTTWGNESDFLGAHVAISRWPLTEHKPRPKPRSSVTVRRAAVLTAKYEGVVGWPKLPDAEAEAEAIAGLFTPRAVTVLPSFADVAHLFEGTPRAELLHVALHGQFDAKGDQGGLVVLGTDAQGQTTSSSLFFTADHVQSGRLDDGPFVFLNACQVASDKAVLGDYGGFASTLLRIGACGVVAPLWNVDDDVAAAFAREFYAATWTATGEGDSPVPVSAAEAVRALRARYTQKDAETQTKGVTATLIAFQVFGHPRLRLDRGA